MSIHTDIIGNFLKSRSRDALQRQQLITYLIATGLVFFGMSFHLLHFLGAKMPVLRFLSVLVLTFCFVFFVMWLLRKVSLKVTLLTTSFVVQAVQIVKIIYISVALPDSYNYLITLNGLISMMLMTVLSISYYRTAALLVGASNSLLLVLVAFREYKENALDQAIILIVLFTVFFMIMADMMYRNVKNLQLENRRWQKGEQRLLAILRMNRNEIKAYVEMCRTENLADGDTDRLFGMLSEKSQRNVIKAVEKKLAIDASRNKDIQEVFGDFTPMEMEVARMVVRGLKLSKIAELMGKTESNISVVRSRIRKKIGLPQGNDLRKALMEKLGDNA